jgi:lysozyme
MSVSAMNLSPVPAPKGNKRLKGSALIAFIAATVALVAPVLTEPNEGYRGKVYLDPAKILTQCFGETRDIDPSRIYSKDQCAAKLRVRMAKDYAAPLIACVPDFADPRYQWAFGASIDASYNAGPAAVCRSPMAKAFNAGDWSTGCSKFVGWYETAKGVRYPGLVRRRREEASFCLTGRKS